MNQLNQIPQIPQNQFPQVPQNQFPQVPQNQFPQVQFPQNQFPQVQFPQNQFPQIQLHLPQNQLFPIIQFPQLPQIQLPPYQFPQFPDMLEMAHKMKIRDEQNKINITKKEITDMLTQDSYYRKLKQWPLLILDEISILNRGIDEMFNISSYNYSYVNTNMIFRYSDVQKKINRNFPYIDELLVEFNGHLVACGGAVVKSIFDGHSRGDIDLFFYDLTIEEANKMRLDAIEFLINSYKDDTINYHIKRNEFTTTLYITNENNNNDFYEYQFIHRIYPDMSSIIGGFDLSICMVAYDGKQIYATPLGAWSIQNKSIIIDTKRRSTSFEYRLQKYSFHGHRLIFPGISNEVIQNFHNKSPSEKKMSDEIKTIAKKYGFEYTLNWEDFEFVGNIHPECSSYNIQKKEDILPYFKLRGNEIATPKYDRKNIEDRLINKISDYSMLSNHPISFPTINAQQLRSDNLHSVSSILKIDIKDDIRNQLIEDIENPDLMINDSVITRFYDRVEKIKIPFKNKYGGYKEIEDKNIDFYRLTKCFGKLTSKVIEIRNTDEYYKYCDIVIDKMITNAEICKEKLVGVKWITQNLGRQWTSSINPIIADPREWYGKHYEPVVTGIPQEVETIMRLMRLSKTESVWNMIDNDVFDVICLHLLYEYSNDAWSYIL
jgi:hypothetical protein